MDLKAHAKHAMGMSRKILEGMIESLSSPSDWLHQVHEGANHPMWVVGHLALADNMFASMFRPDVANKPDGWDDLFWFGTEPQSEASAYPASDEVLAYFRDRRETLLSVLEELSDEELAAPAPGPDEFSPVAGAPSMGHAFLFVSYHEGLHTGQLSVARRALGNSPLFQPPS